ncbi:MAG: hypothetical protein V4547_16760 [Bacteroidota bacterium]
MQTLAQPTQKITFINEWTPEQFKTMNKAIAAHFSHAVWLRYGNGSESHKTRIYRSFSQIDGILGLAYTSTGVWACYGVCNTQAYFDLHNTYQYSYFVMDKNNDCYAILQDKDENEIIIPL